MTQQPDEVILARRRAVGVLVLSAFVPGSVQWMSGSRKVGGVALKIWAGLVGLGILVGLGAWLAPGFTLGVVLTPWIAGTARVLTWVLFAAWLYILVDAWRLARPMSMPRITRLAMTIAAAVLAIAMGAAATVVAGAFQAAGNVGMVLPGGGDTEQKAGRYNVLLLGADSSDQREGLRPDSINVASIDVTTGRTVLFGLPRNLQRVPFPEDSPLYTEFPNGFQCDDGECMLNAVWTAAEDRKDRFPKDSEPGLETTQAVVEQVLGLDINYYAIVDMHGFSSIIDAMGGIKIDVMKRIPIGGGSSPISGYIEPGKAVHLDGQHALWFARSREGSSDYERMQRQKCVLKAMASQLDPQTVATRFVELSEAGKDLLQTNVPRDQLVVLAELALKAKSLPVASVDFAPPLVPNTADPDFGMIRRTVQQTIEEAEDADVNTASPSPSASALSASTVTDAEPSSSAKSSTSADAAPYSTGQTDDLATVCEVA